MEVGPGCVPYATQPKPPSFFPPPLLSRRLLSSFVLLTERLEQSTKNLVITERKCYLPLTCSLEPFNTKARHSHQLHRT